MMTRMHEAMKAGDVREMEGQVREKFWRLRRAKGRSAREMCIREESGVLDEMAEDAERR